MPDVIKQDGFILTERVVQIPDYHIPLPPQPEEEPEMEEEGENPEEDLVEEEAVPPPPPEPEWVPTLPTREELEATYKSELQEVCQQAAQKAHSDALQEKRQDIQKTLDEVGSRLDEMQNLQAQYLEQCTQELKYMAVDIAKKLVLKKIDEDDMILSDLVMQAVGSVKNSDWLQVEVSEQLVGLVEHLKSELRKPAYEGKAEVYTIAAPKDTCRVTTGDGTVVATVSVQAENLRKIFERI